MTDGHSSPPAHEASTAAPVDNSTAPPVPADVRANGDHHAQGTSHSVKEKGSAERLTPRPTFMEHLATSRDSQFHLDRRDSSELERYFVREVNREIVECQKRIWRHRLTIGIILAWPS